MSSELFATETEIRHASSILLPEGQCFFDDPQRKAIIESNESVSIKACPGSGKTTTLLAKLIILANRFPFDDGRGICVLTHTNVAIDEIKARLGAKSDVLFRYPNFFGTIQSFVDQFMAIPYLQSQYGGKGFRFDNDRYIKRIRDIYYQLPWGAKDEKTLQKHLYSKGTNAGIWDSLTHSQRHENGAKLLSELEFDYTEEKVKTSNGRTFLTGSTKSPQAKIKFDQLFEIKNTLMRQGVLRYYDAFSLAQRYLRAHPKIKATFSPRFRYVFLDEMQDNEKHQLDLIESLFSKSDSIVQCYGDPHQSIYTKVNAESIWNPTDALPIHGTKRFGEQIAKVLRTVCIEDNNILKPNPTVTSAVPVMIVFEDPASVLPKYSSLLATTTVEIEGKSMNIWQASEHEEKPIKAVGWVGKKRDDEKLTTSSYFSDFEKDLGKKEKKRFYELGSYIYVDQNTGAKTFYHRILEATLHMLGISGARREVGTRKNRYTKTSFYTHLEENSEGLLGEFRESCASWGKRLLSHGEDLSSEIKAFLEKRLLPAFGIDAINSETRAFLDAAASPIKTVGEATKPNCYVSPDNPDHEIQVSTIHSVKGETHTATLYLETSFFGKYESENIKSQLLGTPFKPRRSDTRIRETLKVAYVGMSRPKFMLCYAIHSSRFDKSYEIDNGGNWKVVFA